MSTVAEEKSLPVLVLIGLPTGGNLGKDFLDSYHNAFGPTVRHGCVLNHGSPGDLMFTNEVA